MIGFGANLMPVAAAVAGALNTGYASGADLEYLFAERGSLVAAAGNALISCTRSGATATCFNRSGQLETVPANTPRLNFDPATLRYENLVTYSRKFANAAWVKSSGASALDETAIAPDGTLRASTLTFTSSSSLFRQAVTLTNSAAHVVTVWLRSVSGDTSMTMDLGDGTGVTQAITSTLTRYTLSLTAGTNDWIDIRMGGAAVVEAYGLNLNTGTTALDYSETEATAKAKEYACKGLLVEESRVNLETWSADYSNAAYTKVGLNAVTTNNAGAPDGTSTFNKLPEDSSTGLHTAVRNVTVVAGSTYTVSRFFKAAENSLVQLLFDDTATTNGVYANFNISAGTITKAIAAFGTGTAVTAGIESCGNGIYRAYIVGTAGTVATTARVAVTLINSGTATQFPSYTGVSGNGLYVWGSDTQLGSFILSHIPTTSSTAQRFGDVITIGNVSSWFNSTEGTVVSVSTNTDDSTATFPRVWCASDGTTSQFVQVVLNSASNTIFGEVINVGHTFQTNNSFSSYTGARTKVALAYKANDTAIAKDGVCNTADTSVTLPTGVNKLTLGSDNGGNSPLNGHIERWAYWRTRETNTYLAALTA
jgi:hypothetical protein